MDINLMCIVFVFASLFTGSVGMLVNYMEPYLPVFITRTYRFGKFGVTADQPIVAKFEVPKRYYRHFYTFAAISSTYTLYLVICRYFYNTELPESVNQVLNILLGSHRRALVSPESTFVVTVLMTIQCWKRFYETHCVNVFSDSNINICHYIIGYLHYVGVLTGTIGESKGFVKGSVATFSWEKITLTQLVCAVIFLWSTYAQLQANYILRDLRKNEDGKVVSAGYKIPHGGLFEYVSGALQYTEILLYITTSIILWQGATYHFVTVWVLTNQAECAFLTHWWYQKNFKNYPKTRKALIPYLL